MKVVRSDEGAVTAIRERSHNQPKRVAKVLVGIIASAVDHTCKHVLVTFWAFPIVAELAQPVEVVFCGHFFLIQLERYVARVHVHGHHGLASLPYKFRHLATNQLYDFCEILILLVPIFLNGRDASSDGLVHSGGPICLAHTEGDLPRLNLDPLDAVHLYVRIDAVGHAVTNTALHDPFKRQEPLFDLAACSRGGDDFVQLDNFLL
mmetsp:Transcript_22071/g.66247  ORF Transcript_22071/g.66247 Transcript_22071/m.66247 type:complete len:206 (+) Transcript_22071:2455-3072(+)